MKNTFIIVYTSFLLLLLTGCTEKTAYLPVYKEQWPQVETFIRDNWHTSKIDSIQSAEATYIALAPPKAFMSISAGNPVLFYWDNYFTNKGLLRIDSLSIYAKNATDNLLWEVEQLGFVPNANMTWGMNRSQTPYLALMVWDVYRKTGDQKWLQNAYETLKKEYHFWTDTSATAIEDHNTSVEGLQRFYHHASTDELLTLYDAVHQRGLLKDHPDSLTTGEKCAIAGNFAAEAETMDFNPRFENRCPDYIALDLNCNLYRYELIFKDIVKILGLKGEPDWEAKAEKRKELINQYCWNEQRGLYMDYDFVNKKFSPVASIVCMYPLLAGIASEEQAELMINQLPLFEYPNGVTVCEQAKKSKQYMWDFPVGWPPVYLLTIQALRNYGYEKQAQRICIKYLDVVTRNFLNPIPKHYMVNGESKERQPGFLYEKYDVVNGGIDNTEYPSNEFLGWSAGVFIWCLDYYRESQK
ncbi:MAG: trehalase family glycosidase [Bacteroidales bacterium]|nr:trehalase family glycosidase [Bacteroidales bacterium]